MERSSSGFFRWCFRASKLLWCWLIWPLLKFIICGLLWREVGPHISVDISSWPPLHISRPLSDSRSDSLIPLHSRAGEPAGRAQACQFNRGGASGSFQRNRWRRAAGRVRLAKSGVGNFPECTCSASAQGASSLSAPVTHFPREPTPRRWALFARMGPARKAQESEDKFPIYYAGNGLN